MAGKTIKPFIVVLIRDCFKRQKGLIVCFIAESGLWSEMGAKWERNGSEVGAKWERSGSEVGAKWERMTDSKGSERRELQITSTGFFDHFVNKVTQIISLTFPILKFLKYKTVISRNKKLKRPANLF